MFFNTPKASWFAKHGISDLISFRPNQIIFLSPSIKQNLNFIYILIGDNFPFKFSLKLFDFNQFTYLNTMAVSILDLHFYNMDDLVWFNEKINSDTPFTNYYLINNQIGKWYNYIKGKEIWHFIDYWTCKMWVVLILLHLLFDLVVDKYGSARGIT